MKCFKVKIGEFVHHAHAEDESEAIRKARLICGDSKLAPEVSVADPDELEDLELDVELDSEEASQEPGTATGETATKSEANESGSQAKPKPKPRKPRAK
jgi:hypothetical protein